MCCACIIFQGISKHRVWYRVRVKLRVKLWVAYFSSYSVILGWTIEGRSVPSYMSSQNQWPCASSWKMDNIIETKNESCVIFITFIILVFIYSHLPFLPNVSVPKTKVAIVSGKLSLLIIFIAFMFLSVDSNYIISDLFVAW